MQSDKHCQTKTHPSDCQIEKHDESREHVYSALETSGGVLYTTVSDTTM